MQSNQSQPDQQPAPPVLNPVEPNPAPAQPNPAYQSPQPSQAPPPTSPPQQPVPPPQYPAQGYQQPQPMPGYPNYPPQTQNPGQGMAIAGLIVGFFAPIVGVVLCIIAMNKSKNSGQSNGLAIAGLILSIIFFVVQAIVGTIFLLGIIGLAQACSELGPGVHYIDGSRFTCS